MKLARSYEYEARTPDVSLMLSMPGLEYLRGILRGDHPAAPIAATLNFTLTELDYGRAVFEGVRAITDKTKRVRCEATIIHAGSTVATAEAKLLDDRGQLCAHGTTTCLVMSPR